MLANANEGEIMTTNILLEVLGYVVSVVLAFVSWYFKNSAKAKEKVAEVNNVFETLSKKAVEYIAKAEDLYKDIEKSGQAKAAYVLDEIYTKYVPSDVQQLITKEMVEELIQNRFNDMQNFAAVQLDQLLDKYKLFGDLQK